MAGSSLQAPRVVTKLKKEVKFQKLIWLAPATTSFRDNMNPGKLGSQTHS